MSFFHVSSMGKSNKEKDLNLIKTLKVGGCSNCPLNNADDLQSPKMQATGDLDPKIYILGEAPGAQEDAMGEQFVGQSGQLLRKELDKYGISYRLNNTIRCRPPNNRNPEKIEVECCRGYIEDDIAKSRPLAILGAGAFPLEWGIKESGIMKWRGKKIPVNIKGHRCWYFPILHPAYILRYGRKDYDSYLYKFQTDIKNALYFLQYEYRSPICFGRKYSDFYKKGIAIITGKKPGDFRKIKSMFSSLRNEKLVTVDIETNGLRPYKKGSKILTMALGIKNKTWAFPIDFDGEGIWTIKERVTIRSLLKDFLENKRITKIAYNTIFELEWLVYFYGDDILESPWYDVMAMRYAMGDRKGTLSLDFGIKEHFGFSLKDLSKVNIKRLENEPLEKVLLYNGMDTKWTMHLFFRVRSHIENTTFDVHEFLVRTCKTLVLTQKKGLQADLEFIEGFSEELDERIKESYKEFYGLPELIEYKKRFKSNCNPNSPQQLVKLLRDILQREEGYKKDGKYGTGEDVLSSIPSDETKVPRILKEIRTNQKLKGTYADGLLDVIYEDGRFHTSYHHLLTETGRLSSSDPNTQNWPKQKHKEVRKSVKADDGYWLVCADYGQIEARIIAAASKDKYFIKALQSGYDIHAEWRDKIIDAYPDFLDNVAIEFNLDDEKKIMGKARFMAKNQWVFPLFYGAMHFSCADNLGIPVDVADELHIGFWEVFSGVKEWQERTLDFYKRNGYIANNFGLVYNGVMDVNKILNYPIQGGASFVVVDAMNRLSNEGKQAVLNVHDELGFLVENHPYSIIDEIDYIGNTMADVPFDFIRDQNIPISVEVTMGKNYCDQEFIGEYIV